MMRKAMPRIEAGANRGALWAGLLFLAGSMLWVIASPLGSVPDEPAHFVRAAAAVRGQIDLVPDAARPEVEVATVPAYVADLYQRTCYVGQADVTADCEGETTHVEDDAVTTVTTAGLNSPVFYIVVGLPSLVLSNDLALYAMRVVSVVWCSLIWGWSFWHIARVATGRPLALAGLAAATPMVQYLAGSVNPNGVEVVGALGVASGLIAFVHGRAGELKSSLALTLAGAVMATSARTVGLIWVLVAVGVVLMSERWGVMIKKVALSSLLKMAAVLGLPSALAVLWFVSQSNDSAHGVIAAPMSSGEAMVHLVRNFLSYARGYVGLFGWLDTPLPPSVYVVYGVVLVGLVGFGIWRGESRWRAPILALVALLGIVPVVLQGVLAPSVGFIWQGRYALALVPILLFVGAISLSQLEIQRRGGYVIAIVATITLSAVYFAAFTYALRRYVVGEGNSIVQMFSEDGWVPPIPIWALLALYFCICGVGALGVLEDFRNRHSLRFVKQIP